MNQAFFDELEKSAGVVSTLSRVYSKVVPALAFRRASQARQIAQAAQEGVASAKARMDAAHNLAVVAPILGIGGGVAAGIAAAKATRKRD